MTVNGDAPTVHMHYWYLMVVLGLKDGGTPYAKVVYGGQRLGAKMYKYTIKFLFFFFFYLVKLFLFPHKKHEIQFSLKEKKKIQLLIICKR
jgi:hypothetical protein